MEAEGVKLRYAEAIERLELGAHIVGDGGLGRREIGEAVAGRVRRVLRPLAREFGHEPLVHRGRAGALVEQHQRRL